MPVYHLTAQLIDNESEQVLAVRRQPFVVLHDHEDKDEVLRELEAALAQAENDLADLEAARDDPDHHHHHWWHP